jgi:hypothetical protein
MTAKFLFIASLVLVAICNGNYVVPVQPGVKNTISFDCSVLGGSGGAGALGPIITNSGASPDNDYTYTFTGLPSWASANGPIVSGVAPSTAGSYPVTVAYRPRAGTSGQSGTINVVLNINVGGRGGRGVSGGFGGFGTNGGQGSNGGSGDFAGAFG